MYKIEKAMKKLTSVLFSLPVLFTGLTASTCAQGYCNMYGCSSCGVCNMYGCPDCGRNSSGYGGGSGATQTCNMYGCGVSPNMYGSSPNGECTMYGCP